MKIFTSIMPNRHDVQRQCINSWVLNGFAPISVNIASEIEDLKATYPDVGFIKAPGDNSKIRVNDLLSILPNENLGIVNSDIFLTIDSDQINKMITKSNLIIGNRVDTHDLRKRDGALYDGGFDIFFFNGANKSIIKEVPFRVGEPAWDYWFPMTFLKAGKQVILIDGKFSYHLIHKRSWNHEMHVRCCAELSKIFEVPTEGHVWRHIMAHVKRIKL